MAEELVGMKCCAKSFLNYSNLSEVQNCVKCAELEIQLQQVLDELSSVQLIVQMLNKEHVQEEQTVVTENHYTTLETDSSTPRNENRTKTIYENKPRAISNKQKEKMKCTLQDCLTTKEPQEERNMKTKVELNLQNPSLTHQQSNIKEEEETYTITSIINGRISRKHTGRTIKQRTSLQTRVKMNTSKKTVTLACRRHKIVIIGDSPVRGLLEKISNCLDDSFSVIGITKSNADIEAITSPLHLLTNNLPKKDLIIIWWN